MPEKSAQEGRYVLVHGAWLSGDMYDDIAYIMRSWDCTVFTPTLAGNRPGDPKTTGLSEAIDSLVGFIKENNITDAVLVGHSWGGMVVTGAADRLPAGTIRRLVYWNAFVPNDGESLADLNPPAFNLLFEEMKREDGGIDMPFEIFREALMPEADHATAEKYFQTLNPQPYMAMHEKIKLSANPCDMKMGKSYIHVRDDVGYPTSLGGYHPRFSERLGLFRYLSMPGGHQACWTNPALLAEKIVHAGRD